MIRILSIFLLLLMAGGVAVGQTVAAGQIVAVAPTLPSLVLSVDGKVPSSGRAYDLVKEAARIAGVKVTFEIQPWVRAYMTATTNRNTLLFPVARTAEREDLFEWLGPVNRLDYSVFQLASSTLSRPTTVEQLKGRATGVLRNDAIHNYLKNFLSAKDLIDVAEYESLIQMFLAGRVDFIAVVPGSFQAELLRKQVSAGSVERLFDLPYTNDPNSYVVLAKGSDSQLVQGFKRALAAMQKDGTWQKIFDRY